MAVLHREMLKQTLKNRWDFHSCSWERSFGGGYIMIKTWQIHFSKEQSEDWAGGSEVYVQLGGRRDGDLCLFQWFETGTRWEWIRWVLEGWSWEQGASQLCSGIRNRKTQACGYKNNWRADRTSKKVDAVWILGAPWWPHRITTPDTTQAQPVPSWVLYLPLDWEDPLTHLGGPLVALVSGVVCLCAFVSARLCCPTV